MLEYKFIPAAVYWQKEGKSLLLLRIICVLPCQSFARGSAWRTSLVTMGWLCCVCPAQKPRLCFRRVLFAFERLWGELRILGFKANPQPGGETLLCQEGHSPGQFTGAILCCPGTVRPINEKWVFFPDKFLLYPQFFKAKCHFRIYSNLKVVKFLWTELYLSKHCPWKVCLR